jgi:hypothetical protein
MSQSDALPKRSINKNENILTTKYVGKSEYPMNASEIGQTIK